MALPAFFEISRAVFKRVLGWILFLLIIPTIFLWWLMAQPGSSGERQEVLQADPDFLKEQVKILSENFYPRNCFQTANLDRCAEHIFRQFQECGLETRFEEYKVGDKTCKNVVGLHGMREKLTVVGAHYDSCQDTPGADDNASGVAGLLELARLLKKGALEKNVELVAYTLEEPPFFRSPQMGSAIHARNLVRAGVDVRAVIVLEMIGRFSDDAMSQDYPLPVFRFFYPSRANFIVVTGKLDQRAFTKKIRDDMRNTSSVPLVSINAPMFIPGMDYSDHRNYWAEGMPAVMITDTSFYRNKDYHQVGDTREKLDYERMAQVVTGVYGALVRSAYQ